MVLYINLNFSEMDSLAIKNVPWQKSRQIPLTSWTICGYSRSAYRTSFYIPELGIMLDAGHQNFKSVSHIFLTHTHIDHLASLPFTLIDSVDKLMVPTVYGPKEAESYVGAYIVSMFNVNSMRDWTKDSSYQAGYVYSGLVGGEFFRCCINKTNLMVRVFICDHSIPTVSYGFSVIKTKLKPEYLGLSGKEIVELKKTGVEISQEVVEKKFAYICDTSIAVLLQTEILEYPVVFIECTFLMPDELENAVETRHIHWDHLKPYVLAHPEIIFILFHFSQRYKDLEINAFFQPIVDSGIKNLQWWA